MLVLVVEEVYLRCIGFVVAVVKKIYIDHDEGFNQSVTSEEQIPIQKQ